MKTKTKQILAVLKVISWIIFFGICIQTGAIIFTFIYSFFNPLVAQNLYLGLDLSNLYKTDIANYSFMVSCIIILSGLKAYMFFFVVKIFLKVDFRNPFKIKLVSFISKISYFAFLVWAIAFTCTIYSGWLLKKGIVNISKIDLQHYFGGSSEFFFLGIIVFIISQIFKRGIEIQSENDLTV